jgi:hypothetical protein
MKTIDLGEKLSETAAMPSKPSKKWYPTVSFSDNGVGGVSSFDDKDVGKTIEVKANIKLTGINSRTDHPKGKRFDYTFEVHKIHMPDDLGNQADALKTRQDKQAKKRGVT